MTSLQKNVKEAFLTYVDTATMLLSNAVQQSMVVNQMKYCKQLQIYSVMQKEIEKLITSPKDTHE